jgi:hypothetical protein
MLPGLRFRLNGPVVAVALAPDGSAPITHVRPRPPRRSRARKSASLLKRMIEARGERAVAAIG